MDKIKSNMHRGNKHFVLGLSFVVFSLIASVVWGLTYAEDTTLVTTPTTPLPVVNLVGTVSGNSIIITWTNTSTNQDKFNISRRMNGGALIGVAMIPGPEPTSYTDSTVIAGNTYDYQVEACLSGTGCSYMTQVAGILVPSTSNSTGTTTTTSTTCTGLNLVLNDGKTTYTVGQSVNYTWTCIPSGSTGTVSIWLNKPDGTMVNYNTGTGSNTQSMGFSTSNLVPGNYVLKACLGTSCTTAGTIITAQTFSVVAAGTITTTNTNDTVKPVAPTNLTARVDGNNVVLNWVDNSNNEAGFKIYRGPVWTDIGNVGPNVTTITYSGLAAGTYTYHLNAFNSSYLYSPISNDVTVTVGGTTTPTTPNTTTTTTNTTTCTGLNLVLNDGKTSYTVGQSVNYTWTCIPSGSTGTVSIWLNKPDGTMVNYNTGTGSNTQSMGFSTSNLVPGNYVLKACLGTSCTTAGTIITAQTFSVVAATTGLTNTILGNIPNSPSNLSLYGVLTSLSKSIALKWTDNANNEDKFNIERKLSTSSAWSYLNLIMGSNLVFYTDNAVTPGVSYDYRVQACLTNVGCSAYATLEKVIIPTINNILNPLLIVSTTPPLTSVIDTTVNPVVSPPIVKTPATTAPVSTTKLITDDTMVPSITKSITTVPISNDEISSSVVTTAVNTTDVKVIPVVIETPKQIIDNVIETLNIIPKIPEVDLTQTADKKEEVLKEETIKQDKIKEEVTKLIYQDTNKDGISDYDSKYVYNMDPVKPSPTSIYEGKSVTAGEKILLGFDPGKKELEKVVVEEPTNLVKPEIVVNSYKVNEVKLTEKKEVSLKGQALPNSFITLYIYSTPIMVTVKTDSNGEWQYTLDKELENGNHTVYTATVNNTGNIVAKSTPFTFVKTAEAVTLQDILPVQGVQTVTVEKPGFLQSKNIFIMLISGLMMIGIMLILIGLFSKKTTQ